jgi:hypothetical protein
MHFIDAIVILGGDLYLLDHGAKGKGLSRDPFPSHVSRELTRGPTRLALQEFLTGRPEDRRPPRANEAGREHIGFTRFIVCWQPNWYVNSDDVCISGKIGHRRKGIRNFNS